MDLIPVRKSTINKSGKEEETFIVPAISMRKSDGTSAKVPHPQGPNSLVFKSLEKAIEAIDRAGFGYIYDEKQVPASDVPLTFNTDLTGAVDPLLEMLKDSNSSIVASAAYALGELKTERAIKPLLGVLGVDDQLVRKNAVEALAKIGDPAVRGIIEALDDNNWVTRNSASIALGEMVNHSGRKVLYAIQPLIKRLKDSNWIVRSSAATSLGKIAAFIREKQKMQP
jgi:hypothetical protein